MDDEKLLLAEYEQYSEAFWKNEEAGERRLTFFVTLTTAIVAAIVALLTSDKVNPNLRIKPIALAALSGALIFGIATFVRMLQRDRVTDEYKAVLRYLREELRKRANGLEEYELPRKSGRHYLLRGGLAVTVALMNSFILAVLTALLIEGDLKWLTVVAAFLVSFVVHALGVKTRHKGEESCQTFRVGVGAVIMNDSGKVLALERKDVPGAWQMPQGGMKIGEGPLDAATREIKEETGIKKKYLQKMSSLSRPLFYELPKEHRSQKTGRGQIQYWFVFRFLGSDDDITLGDNKEFSRWKWTTMDEVVANVVEFKKPVYKELVTGFAREFGKG